MNDYPNTTEKLKQYLSYLNKSSTSSTKLVDYLTDMIDSEADMVTKMRGFWKMNFTFQLSINEDWMKEITKIFENERLRYEDTEIIRQVLTLAQMNQDGRFN